MSIFDEKTDRRHTGSMKWDVTEKELPMWVADMDFQTAPQITEAIIKRAQHGVFGYTLIEDEWYDAYQNWWKTRHEWSIEKEWLIFCCLKLLPENHRSPDNKRTADHPRHRFADAYGDIAPDRDEPDGKDNFTNQFQRTAYQRCFQVLHSLQCVS